jgi:hypothetical protein
MCYSFYLQIKYVHSYLKVCFLLKPYASINDETLDHLVEFLPWIELFISNMKKVMFLNNEQLEVNFIQNEHSVNTEKSVDCLQCHATDTYKAY